MQVYKGLLSIFVMLVLFTSLPSVLALELIESDFSYDAKGNMLSDGVFKYQYDPFNNLKSVTDARGTLLAEYLYDESGQRIKTVDHQTGETTYYFGDVVRVVNSSGSFDFTYYHLDGKLVGMKDYSGKVYYYLTDNVGSIRAVVDANGNVIERISYKPFGEVLDDTQSRYLFTGQEYDNESDLMYYNARYYSPLLRQFTQPDTIIQDAYNPQTLNRYSYVNNNPIRYTDSSGHIIDTLADIGFIGYDIYELAHDGGWKSGWNWAALGGDIVGAAVPFVTGAGLGIHAAAGSAKVAKTVDKGADAAKLVKAANTADNLADISHIKGADELAKTIAKSSDSKVLLSEVSSVDDVRRVVDPKILARSQPSRSENLNYIKDLASEMRSQGKYVGPPVSIIQSEGRMIIVDGHHHTRAAIAAGIDNIPVVKALPGSYGHYNGVPRTFEEAVQDSKYFTTIGGRKW